MRRRGMRLLLLLLALAVALVAACGDMTSGAGLLRAAQARRIVAIGDLHGDYNQSRTVLRITRLIDDHNHWIGEDAYLVQLGDILDVGPDDIKIVELLMRLQGEAREKGGDVIQLLGNHEMRNLRGDYKAVDPGSMAYSGGRAGRDKLLSNETSLGMYLRTRKAIYHYGPFLFMHGGFSTATPSLLTSLAHIDRFNRELNNALVNGTISPLASGGLNLDEEDVDAVANPILVRSIINVKCADLAKVLDRKFAGIRAIVVGHVPHNPRNFDDWRLCGGRLIDVDFGMSRWKQGDPGHVAALEIEDATWHVQLVEATVGYAPEVTPRAMRPRMLLLAAALALLALLSAAVLVRAYRRPRRTTAPLAPSPPYDEDVAHKPATVARYGGV